VSSLETSCVPYGTTIVPVSVFAGAGGRTSRLILALRTNKTMVRICKPT
jgi:hypothetical protein